MTGNNRRGYPLSMVFLMIAVIAVMVAMLTSSLKSYKIGERSIFTRYQDSPSADVDSFYLLLACLAGSGMGAVIGSYTGWQSPRPLLGFLLGLPLGTLVGGLIAMLLICPPDFTIMLSGCAIVLVTAVTTRLLAK